MQKGVLAEISTSQKIVSKILKYTWKTVSYILNVLLTLLLICIIAGAIMGAALAVYIKNNLDTTFDLDLINYNMNLTSSIYVQKTTENGIEWFELEDERIHGSEDREWVSYNEIPKNLINAFVAIEDKRFFSHKGVDIRRTTGAVLGFVTGSSSYGGSTITQQLIKNITGEDEVTIQRKIQEIFRALDLETKYSKEEILELYLNTIYLSQGVYGVQAASLKYFGKPVSELSLVEATALAAIPQAPTKWDPKQNPKLNKERRDVIIKEMYNQGLITLEERDEALNSELILASGNENDQKNDTVHSYYVDQLMEDVITDLQKKYGIEKSVASRMLYSGGLQIYSAMDPDIQNILEAFYENDSNFPSISENGVQPESAMVIIENNTGKIVALVGGRGEKITPRGFNRATKAVRQPGSSIKPLAVYSQAIEQGLITYGTVLDDTPYMYYKELDKLWPSNYPNVFQGRITTNYALTVSKNTVSVKILGMLTPQKSFDFMVENFGFTTLVESMYDSSGNFFTDINYSPLALGGLTKGVTVLEMTAAYSVFPNDGVYYKPKTYLKVLDSSGNVILSNDDNAKIILSEETADIMTKMMENVVDYGTASKLTLRKKIDCAGKTGTTNDTKDLYYCGYTPYYTASVWFGYDRARDLGKFSTSPALDIWDKVMTQIHDPIIQEAKANGTKLKTFEMSPQIITCEYCLDSGMLAGENCNLDPRGKRVETGYFTRDTMPRKTCTVHIPVEFCTESGCVAGENCPETTTKALLDIDMRIFEKHVIITDSQYLYMPLPKNYVFPSSQYVPYYMNLYPLNTYSGLTNSSSKPLNRYCTLHNHELTDAVIDFERQPVQTEPTINQ